MSVTWTLAAGLACGSDATTSTSTFFLPISAGEGEPEGEGLGDAAGEAEGDPVGAASADGLLSSELHPAARRAAVLIVSSVSFKEFKRDTSFVQLKCHTLEERILGSNECKDKQQAEIVSFPRLAVCLDIKGNEQEQTREEEQGA